MAASAALRLVPEEAVLGVGTGAVVEEFVRLMRDRATKPQAIVASSERAAAVLRQNGLTVADPNHSGPLDLYVDGADEWTDQLLLLSGASGSPARAKIAAASAGRFVILAKGSKLVGMLGNSPVAIEVLTPARSHVARKLVALGGDPVLREGFCSDDGNPIIDCRGLDLKDAAGMERKINLLSGVVDCGISALRPADVIFLAPGGKLQQLSRG